jgi:predicted neuraminidase
LLLVYNNSPLERTPLTVAISTDEDKSWPVRRDIATGNHDYGYPYAIQARDGKVHIVYTSDKRSTINHAVLDEAAVLAEQKK